MVRSCLAAVRDGVYLFPEFLPAAVACFSGREYDATKELDSFLEVINVPPGRFQTVDQVHGNKVLLIDVSSRSEIDRADGLVTKEKQLALVIRTADCVPVFFLDPEVPAVGICHGGWRGIKAGIIFRILDIFRTQFLSNFRSMRVAMGPSLCEQCYEVGEEFQNYFPNFVKEKGGRYFFSLRGAVRNQLLEEGVPEPSISISDFCTSCAVDRFFSARREGAGTGRFPSAIMLR